MGECSGDVQPAERWRASSLPNGAKALQRAGTLSGFEGSQGAAAFARMPPYARAHLVPDQLLRDAWLLVQIVVHKQCTNERVDRGAARRGLSCSPTGLLAAYKGIPAPLLNQVRQALQGDTSELEAPRARNRLPMSARLLLAYIEPLLALEPYRVEPSADSVRQ